MKYIQLLVVTEGGATGKRQHNKGFGSYYVERSFCSFLPSLLGFFFIKKATSSVVPDDLKVSTLT